MTTFRPTAPRWPSRRDAGWEIAAVVLLELVTVLVAVAGSLPWEGRFTTPTPWVLLAVQAIVTPLFLWRRQFPIAVGTVMMLTILFAVLPYAPSRQDEFPLVLSLDAWIPIAASLTANGVITFGNRSRRGRIVWTLLAVITVLAARPWQPDIGIIYGGIALAAVPALLGAYLSARGRLVRELRGRAEQAERDRELAAERARAAERMRLASELHDVVTHRISLMVLQAGALRMSTVDEAVRTAAEDLRSDGCRALEELRDMIGVLRVDVRENHDGI